MVELRESGLVDLREGTEERKKDVELFRKLVDSGNTDAIVRLSNNGSMYVIEEDSA